MPQEQVHPYLMVQTPGVGLSTYDLGDEVSIGSLPENTVQLAGPFVSRRHARLERRGDGYEIIDLKSTNRTTLNGKPLEPGVRYALTQGDTIEIPGHVLTFSERSTGMRTDRIPDVVGGEEVGTGGLAVNVESNTVALNGRTLDLRLSPTEWKLLVHLYQKAGLTCTREELGEAGWGVIDVGGRKVPIAESGMLNQRIHSLKLKLRGVGINDGHLVTLPGIGYRLDLAPPPD